MVKIIYEEAFLIMFMHQSVHELFLQFLLYYNTNILKYQVKSKKIENTNSEIFRTIMQGPLKIWTEHSNFPLQGRGDTKIPIATETQHFF